MTGLNDFRNHPCNEALPGDHFCVLKREHEGPHQHGAPVIDLMVALKDSLRASDLLSTEEPPNANR